MQNLAVFLFSKYPLNFSHNKTPLFTIWLKYLKPMKKLCKNSCKDEFYLVLEKEVQNFAKSLLVHDVFATAAE